MTKYKASPIWTEQPYVKIPADVHVRVAKIAGVPPEEHAAFAAYIEMLIVITRGAAARQDAFSASDVRFAIKRIAKAATTMAAALEQAPVGAKEMLHLTSPTQHSLDEMREITEHLAAAADRVLARIPTHSPWPTVRQLFLTELRTSAERAGGKLGLSSRSESGTLLDALDVLRPHLPAELVRHLSYGTIKGHLAKAKKSRKID